MNQPNTLRTPLSAEARRAEIHLVYSRSWQFETRKQVQPQLVPTKVVAHRKRKSHIADTVSLAIAAMVAPFVWVAHAILCALHVI